MHEKTNLRSSEASKGLKIYSMIASNVKIISTLMSELVVEQAACSTATLKTKRGKFEHNFRQFLTS